MPPSKKAKKSHDSSSLSPEPSPSPSLVDAKDQLPAMRPAGRRGTLEHTPPPSPTDGVVAPKIDTEGINDDIVVAVIEQLEKTGNRPHLVKELAAVLVTLSENVAKYVLIGYSGHGCMLTFCSSSSANPAALLSSRLSAYMKRPWTALAPCPLAKELIPIHPRKVYYYLTSQPRQPLPESLDDSMMAGVNGKNITPSVSSVDQDEEDAMARERTRLSPSPEVDLSSPDFEDDGIDFHGHSGPSGASRHNPDFNNTHNRSRLMHSNRAASPPLEGDEKEFTQTASAVRERASEQKADQHGKPEFYSAITEGLCGLEDEPMSISSSPVGDGSPSASGNEMPGDQYGQYFSHWNSQNKAQDPDEAPATALLGTSPSPSLTSVASSLSSGTSAALDAGLRTEESINSITGAPQISLPEDLSIPSVSTLKRSIDMLNSGLPDVEMKMSDLAEQDDKLSLAMNPQLDTDIEMAFDTWKELQSPETVEVDELDEMFGEI